MQNFIEERTGMANTRLVSALVAAGLIAIGTSTAPAWAGGPGGFVEDDPSDDIFEAVGTGVVGDTLVGFHATGDTYEEAAGDVIAACQNAGGRECTADEVTNDNLCIVSVTDDVSDVVAGGAGFTVEEAREDALRRAAANNTPLAPNAMIVIADCP